MSIVRTVSLTAFALSLTACSHPVVALPADAATAVKPGLITIRIDGLKDKKRKFDLLGSFTNESDGPIVFFAFDFKCSRGGVDGVVIARESLFALRPQEKRPFVIVCDVPGTPTGAFRFSVLKIFDNPGGDGRTPGKILANDFAWTASEPAAEKRRW